ncbi:MAG: glutathione peroxidase [Verrucomicrobiota bacterium]
MKVLITSFLILVASVSFAKEPAITSVHSCSVKAADGSDVELSDYKDKVLLIVNVASQCGATPQYNDLQALHLELESKGFAVLAFPSNEFGGQEPGSNEEILEFCKSNYGVTFPVFAKTSVKGSHKGALFTYLSTAENPDRVGDIRWNFEKFLVGRDGKLLRRFRTSVTPTDSVLTDAITAALEAK